MAEITTEIGEKEQQSASSGTGAGSNGGNRFRKQASYAPDPNRELPQSLDAERGVLCSILLSPNDVLPMCIERIDENHFHHPAHRVIYETFIELWQNNQPIDLIVVTQYLTDNSRLDQAGGAELITELISFVPTAANASYYVDILREKFLLRQVITVSTEFGARAYEEQSDATMLLDDFESNVLTIGKQRFEGKTLEMKDYLMQAVDSIEKLYHNRGGVSGLSTGFSRLDQMTSGLHEAEMIVIAARPSMGKTAFSMNIAEHVAVDCGKPVGVFSLEMSSQQLVQRLLCSRAKVNLARVRDGMLGKNDLQNLVAASNLLAKTKMYIDDTAGLSILELRAKARRMKDAYDIQLIVIDYLQLLRSTSRRASENRQIEIAEISTGIKGLAKELSIPVIVLAQLNREPEKRGDGKPRVSDLRESGSIEQDADVVGLLVRAEVYEKDDDVKKEKEGEAELIIAKQRNGPIGEVPLTFLKEYTRFEDRAFTPEGEG